MSDIEAAMKQALEQAVIDGLVERVTVDPDDPDKDIFRLTAAGEAAVRDQQDPENAGPRRHTNNHNEES